MDLKSIQHKRAEVEAELKGIDERRIELEQFLRDLVVTERTLAKLSHVDLPEEPAAPTQPNKSRKPADIPSVHQMAVIVIRERGEEWVDGAEIVAAIKHRWWPTATSNDITPTLWRLAVKDSRLRKEGSRYALPIGRGMVVGGSGGYGAGVVIGRGAGGVVVATGGAGDTSAATFAGGGKSVPVIDVRDFQKEFGPAKGPKTSSES